MAQYILAGLALGAIYAIAASSLVVTYVSSGVLNFAFGSMAFFVARFYYFLNSQHGWDTDTAGVVSLLVVAPVLGVVLYGGLFRYLRGTSTLTKLVATIGLSVALPPIADFAFGSTTITTAPGLASLNDKPFHFLGTPVTTDEVITYGFLLFILIGGTYLLRATNVGLKVRAMVDSEALASLSGTDPERISVGVWALSATLAGLAGILVAPTNGLNTVGMTTLMAAAFTAVVVARLRSLPGAVMTALAMGVVTDVIQKYLPANSSYTTAIIPSIPFAFLLIALIVYVIRAGGTLSEGTGTSGPLDQAIRPAQQDADVMADQSANMTIRRALLSASPLVLVAALPLVFDHSEYWLGLVVLGLCYAITFLTFTIVTGEGGMLWLSQISFAGAGAVLTAQFATNGHLPVLLAIFLAGLVAGLIGAVIGLLTIRLGDLYVALGTLTFGLLIEGLVFTRNRFLQDGAGVYVNRPTWLESDLHVGYLALGVFVVFGLLIINLRRSTTGLALQAVRDSEPAARTIGLSVVQIKVIIGSLAAFIAAIGGGFIALDQEVAQPQSYATFLGLIWLAVVVTFGVRSITAAALSGLSFALLPGIFEIYVPVRWAEVPSVLFGLGAITVARHPEGVIAQNARRVRDLTKTVLARLAASAGVALPAAMTDEGAAAP